MMPSFFEIDWLNLIGFVCKSEFREFQFDDALLVCFGFVIR